MSLKCNQVPCIHSYQEALGISYVNLLSLFTLLKTTALITEKRNAYIVLISMEKSVIWKCYIRFDTSLRLNSDCKIQTLRIQSLISHFQLHFSEFQRTNCNKKLRSLPLNLWFKNSEFIFLCVFSFKRRFSYFFLMSIFIAVFFAILLKQHSWKLST